MMPCFRGSGKQVASGAGRRRHSPSAPDTGMENAILGVRKHPSSPPRVPEDLIRALSVSLVAVAAIVASLAMVRYRLDDRRAETQPAPEGAHAAAELDLDGIRSAGF